MLTKSISLFALSVVLVGCIDSVPAYRGSNDLIPAAAPYRGTITLCEEEYGCRDVWGAYYFTTEDGETYYYDSHFEVWIGESGYWTATGFVRGPYPGIHEYYHNSYYPRPPNFIHDSDHHSGNPRRH